MRGLERARSWSSSMKAKAHTRATARAFMGNIPTVFAPPYGGAQYYGRAFRWEQVLHYKYWVFVAIRAWIHEMAGGAPPKLGRISAKPEAQRQVQGPSVAAGAGGIEGAGATDLRSTVGGFQAITDLQAKFYAGEIAQEAAIANVVLLFGFSKEEAASLFPMVRPQLLAQAKRYKPRRKTLGGPESHQEFEAYEHTFQMVKTFKKPNSYDTWYDFMSYHTLFKKLTGISYWWVIKNGFGVPVEMWVIPTHWAQLLTDGAGRPTFYWVQSPFGFTQEVPFEDVVVFTEASPLNRWEGMAVTTAMAEWIDVHESETRVRIATFKNGAVPSIHIALGESYADPDEAFLARFYSKWFSRFGGEDNAGRPLVTGGDIEVKDIGGSKPADILRATLEGEDQLRDIILTGYQVPKGVVGLEPTADVSAYAPQRQFCRYAINPELHGTGQRITEDIVKPADPDGICYWDDRVIDDPEQRMREIESRRAGASITPNEERAEYGDEPYPHGGDDPILNGAPVPWVTGKKGDEDLEGAFTRALNASRGASGGYAVEQDEEKRWWARDGRVSHGPFRTKALAEYAIGIPPGRNGTHANGHLPDHAAAS